MISDVRTVRDFQVLNEIMTGGVLKLKAARDVSISLPKHPNKKVQAMMLNLSKASIITIQYRANKYCDLRPRSHVVFEFSKSGWKVKVSLMNFSKCLALTDGPPGPPGPTGPPGQTGPTGSKGDPGIAGLQGQVGNTGATGGQGGQGIQGNPGSAGQTGTTGDIGPRGNDGTPGTKGDQGSDGSQGIQGNAGYQGSPGFQGIQGFQGTPGDKGETGLIGAPGNTGPKGAQGDPGVQGGAGTQGAKGEQGSAGSSGGTGATGLQGSPGAKGETGPRGPNPFQPIQYVMNAQSPPPSIPPLGIIDFMGSIPAGDPSGLGITYSGGVYTVPAGRYVITYEVNLVPTGLVAIETAVLIGLAYGPTPTTQVTDTATISTSYVTNAVASSWTHGSYIIAQANMFYLSVVNLSIVNLDFSSTLRTGSGIYNARLTFSRTM
jgi:hypothetical protein